MALFKILKGINSRLPTTSNAGWVYVTEDTHDMHIFDTDTSRFQLNANYASYLRNENNEALSQGSATNPVYFDKGKPVAITYTISKSVPSDAKFTDTTYSAATTSTAGLMSAADKSKLDGIATGATANTGDITGVTAGNGLTGGGSSGSVTLNVGAGTGISVAADTVSLAASGVTAGTYGAAASPSHGGTFAMPSITVDTYGRVTSAGTVNITLPTVSSTDVNVTQTVRTTNGNFPMLLRGTSAGTTTTTTTTTFATAITANPSTGTITATKVVGAVWNDYAEYREVKGDLQAGRVVCENGDDTLSIATERLQPGAEVISDTFGFAIGETEYCSTPIAVSGRVLAYPYEDRNSYCPGDAVCAAPNGTVSKMTREEIQKYPDRIIGTVSAIPSYDKWGSGEVLVNGRIWIKIK